VEIWLYHEELRDLHHLYCIKSSRLDYNVYVIYPLILLAVTCSQPLYIESYSPLCMCQFVPLHEFVYVVLPTCFILSNQVCACWLYTMYGCSCWAFLHIVCILLALVRVNGSSHLGEVICFGISQP
jgi:hypothetical protein